MKREMKVCDRSLTIEVSPQEPPVVKLSGEADFHTRALIIDTFEKLFASGKVVVKADLTDLY